VFVALLAARQPGGLRRAMSATRPGIQTLRGVLLAGEICVMVIAFTILGLSESHAVFACYPLIVAALSGPILGEKVGWRRWSAIGIGLVGVLVILEPGGRVMTASALIPLLATVMFALYSLLTRYVARFDAAPVSFFWTGMVGAVVMTPLGLWHWQPMTLPDWGLMLALCCTAALSHWLLIRAYEVAEASAIQPFAYLQLPFVFLLGVLLFNETIRPNLIVGTAIVVSAGLFTLWRTRVREKRDPA